MSENREIIAQMMLTISMDGVNPPLSDIDIELIPTIRISQENLGILLLLFFCYSYLLFIKNHYKDKHVKFVYY